MPFQGTGVGTVLETQPFSVGASSGRDNSTSVILSQTYTNVSYAFKFTVPNNSLGFWYSISGNTVTIFIRNYYSAWQEISGEVVVYQSD